MINVEEMKVKRYKFLKKLYELTGGDELDFQEIDDLGSDLGFEGDMTEKVAQYLNGEGLIKFVAIGGTICITHWGVVAIEKSVAEPEKPTEYFPSVNIISIEKMSNSQIQQASLGGTQIVTIEESKFDQVKEVIRSLNDSLEEIALGEKQKSDIKAEIQTIDAQMLSSKPKGTIITECLSSVRKILEGATSSALTSEIINKIVALLGG